MPYSVEAPPGKERKVVVDVDVTDELAHEQKPQEFCTPPFVVFVLGGPGCGKGTQCARLKEAFKLVHISSGDLLREEVAAGTHLGNEIQKHMQAGSLVPDEVTMELLKKAMLKHQDTNRFLLDGFPRSLQQAKRFEQEIAEAAFVLYFDASHDTMKSR